MKVTTLLLLGVLVGASAGQSPAFPPEDESDSCPRQRLSEEDIKKAFGCAPNENKYIVTLRQGSTEQTLISHLAQVDSWLENSANGPTGHRDTWSAESIGVYGYADCLTPEIVEDIRAVSDVQDIEMDRIVPLILSHSEAGEEPKKGANLQRRDPGTVKTQHGAPHNLRAISHRFALRNWKKEDATYKYYYHPNCGRDTYAYVLDSGIQSTHKDFEGRAQNGFRHSSSKNDFEDKTGHGTRVAGIIASKTYGVAKKAQVVSVKITESHEVRTSAATAGLTWALNDIAIKGRIGRAVINMSFNLCDSRSLDRLITAAYEQGILVVASAGNDGSFVRGSPAAHPKVITVGSIGKNWSVSPTSNSGPLVRLFAPGGAIPSLGIQPELDGQEASGTSYAAPHVAGLVLNAISVFNIKEPQKITEFLIETATRNQIQGKRRDGPDLVANNNNDKQKKPCYGAV